MCTFRTGKKLKISIFTCTNLPGICYTFYILKNATITYAGLGDYDEEISEDESDIEPILRSDDEDNEGMQPFA